MLGAAASILSFRLTDLLLTLDTTFTGVDNV